MTERLRAAAVIIAAGLCAVVIGWLGARMLGELEELRSAPRDNVQWSLSQIEVDLLHFRDALMRLRAGEADEAETRHRFDLLYSRFDTIARGAAFAALRADPETAGDLAALRGFMNSAAHVVDDRERPLSVSARELVEAAAVAQDAARQLVLQGVGLFAKLSDDRRLRIVDALTAAFGVALALIAALGLSLAVLNHQRATGARRAAEIARSRARLQATLDASHDAIVAVDDRGLLQGFNAAAEQNFGCAAKAALGVEAFSLLAPRPRRAPLRRALRRCAARMRAGLPVRARVETEAQRADGSVFPAEISIAGTPDEQGRPLLVATIRDISARLAAEASLRAGRDAALAADQAKSRLLAVMSHEMRTPLNGVMGVLDLLAETDLDDKQRRYVRIAEAAGELLRRRVDEALDIARLEKDALPLSAEPFDPAWILEETAELTRTAAAAGANTIVVDADPRLEPVVGDLHRVLQVLLNLAGNAAKFTRRGMIRLEARLIDEREDAQQIEFAVRDTGVGVPQSEQRRIFEDFVTLDPSADGAGAGLGLAICRRLVAAMGGEIGVASAAGLGSRFWLRLSLPRAAEGLRPLAPSGATPPPPAGIDVETEAAAIPPLEILVAEDNVASRFVLREMLERAGHRPTMASNGREAVDLAATRRFDAVLMDVSMPVMDGVAAAQAIREAAGDAAPPILTLTAHALPDERRRFAEAGMIEGPTKPVRRAALLQALAAAVSDPTSGPAGGRFCGAPPLPPASRGAGDRRADLAAVPAESEDADAAPDAQDAPPEVDADAIDQLREAVGDAGCAETIARFLGELDAELSALAEAAGAGGSDAALAAAAHRFAAGASLVGAAALHRALAAAETAARRGDGSAARAASAQTALDEMRAELGADLVAGPETAAQPAPGPAPAAARR